MTRQQLEVAHVFRRHGREFISRFERSLSVQQRRVIRDVTSCRTKQLGGHVQRCRDCGHERIAYNSCRNRHCPKCQAGLQAKWMAARERELLPVPYFHVVFTLPKPLAALAFQNKKVIYGMLFQAAAETLAEVAENPRHLVPELGSLQFSTPGVRT